MYIVIIYRFYLLDLLDFILLVFNNTLLFLCQLDLQVPTGWQAAISLDSLKNSHPIDQPVDTPSEIDELFDAISYNKVSFSLVFHVILFRNFCSKICFRPSFPCFCGFCVSLCRHNYSVFFLNSFRSP